MATPIDYLQYDDFICNGYSGDKIVKGGGEDQPEQLSL